MNSKEIKELLDSDDELPLSYNEDPITPAYENENRFDPIIFKWINNTQKRSYFANTKEKPQTRRDSSINGNHFKKYITKGFLSQQNLFCLKSIAGTATDATFLWLVDFLVRKDVQSRYGNSLRSCLVENFPHTNEYLSNNNDRNNICKKKYKIVVKL